MAEEKYLDAIDPAPAPDTPQPAPEAPQTAQPPEADQGKPEGDKRKSAADAADRPAGFVPKQALDQARIEYRDELKREREARERTEARFQQVIDKLYGGQEPQPGPADDIPDPTYDPNGYLAWDRQQKVQQRELQAAEAQQSRAWNEAYTTVINDFEAAKAEDPNIQPAYDALRTSLAQELNLAYGLTGQALAQQLDQTEAQYVMYAHQNRIPIAKLIRGLAQARGWQPAAAQAGQGQAPGSQPAPDTGAQRDPATGQFIERAKEIAASQERNVSLSQAPGAPVKKMSAKELASMPEEAMWDHFRSIAKRPGSKQFDRDMSFS